MVDREHRFIYINIVNDKQAASTSRELINKDIIYEMRSERTSNSYQQLQMEVSNQHSTDREIINHVENTVNKRAVLNVTRKCTISVVLLIFFLLLMTIVATALAVYSFAATKSITKYYTAAQIRSTNKTNEFSTHLGQLAEETWTNISQILVQLMDMTNDQNTRLNQLAEESWTNLSHTLIQFNETQMETLTVQMQVANLQSQLKTVANVENMLKNSLKINCGPGQWHRVAYLNMSDPSQQCPSTWREYNTKGARACGRPHSNGGSCSATSYPTSHEYSQVCGRVIGYQYGSPDAFAGYARIDRIPVDGIGIFHGIPSSHIWSYVGGISQANDPRNSRSKCPCNDSSAAPSTIGNNYYCESGNPNRGWLQYNLYSDDKLWDGLQCEGTCCAGTKSPPWFSVQLPAPRNDAIEIQICGDQLTDDEDTPVELIEIFVQ